MKPCNKQQMMYKNKQLRLINILPGKFYAVDRSDSEPKIELISFECSESYGALRGFVKVFYGSTEVFPTEVFARGHHLTVNTINQDGIERPMQLDWDERAEELKLRSKFVLVTEPIVNLFRTWIDNRIKIKEKEIVELRKMYGMLDGCETLDAPLTRAS